MAAHQPSMAADWPQCQEVRVYRDIYPVGYIFNADVTHRAVYAAYLVRQGIFALAAAPDEGRGEEVETLDVVAPFFIILFFM